MMKGRICNLHEKDQSQKWIKMTKILENKGILSTFKILHIPLLHASSQ